MYLYKNRSTTISPWKLSEVPKTSKVIQRRVIETRKLQINRLASFSEKQIYSNAGLKGKLLEEICQMDKDVETLLVTFVDKNSLSARAFHRTLRLARTIADLQNELKINRLHIAEALSYRQSRYF